jgi:hypothetical protein
MLKLDFPPLTLIAGLAPNTCLYQPHGGYCSPNVEAGSLPPAGLPGVEQ